MTIEYFESYDIHSVIDNSNEERHFRKKGCLIDKVVIDLSEAISFSGFIGIACNPDITREDHLLLSRLITLAMDTSLTDESICKTLLEDPAIESYLDFIVGDNKSNLLRGYIDRVKFELRETWGRYLQGALNITNVGLENLDMFDVYLEDRSLFYLDEVKELFGLHGRRTILVVLTVVRKGENNERRDQVE